MVHIPSTQVSGEDIDFAVDFTVTGPTQINLATARVREGAMAEEAERRKLAEIAAHYTILDHERSRLVPFAMEVTGTMGKLARGLIHRIAAAHVPSAAELDDGIDADDADDEPGAGNRAHAPPVNPEGSIKSARGRRIWTIKSTLVNAVSSAAMAPSSSTTTRSLPPSLRVPRSLRSPPLVLWASD